MTDLQRSLENYFPCDWADLVHTVHRPISLLTSSSHYFSPVAGLMPVYRPSERRRALDHCVGRLEHSGLPGFDHAIEYLHEKYTHNLAPSTIRQAGGVALSFLSFLHKNNRDILRLSRQDIAAYVENDQDMGLKIAAVKTKLRAIYTFIRYLVDQEFLPPDILLNKIQIKLPQLLPRATIANTGGAGANIRSAPGLGGAVIAVLPDGTRVILLEERQEIDGFAWQAIEMQDTQQGWVVTQYLIPDN